MTIKSLVDMSHRKRLDLRVGFRCNNFCRFCAVSHERKFGEKTTEQIKKDLEEAKKNKVDQVDFTGGEPTIRKDIIELIEYAKRLGFPIIQMQTNGRMLTYKKFTDIIVNAGITSIGFLFPSHVEEVYDYITRVKGSYKQCIKGIQNISKYDLQVSTITVINKLNYESLPQTVKFLNRFNRKIKQYFAEFNYMMTSGQGWKNRNQLLVSFRNSRPYIHKSLDIAKRLNLELNIEGVPLCYMLDYFENVVEFGMADEWEMRMGDGIVEDFNKRRLERGRIKAEQCKNCKYDNICNGAYKGYEQVYGFDDFNPIIGKKIKSVIELI